MKSLFIALLLICSLPVMAQNYDCLQFGPKNYFINGNGYVRGMRVDSISTSGSDIIYFPYRSQRISNYLGGGTFRIDTFGGSWLGKKVIKQADGTFLFDNIWDTVIIKSQAHTGDTWIFYSDTSIFSYAATITDEDTMTISGIPDSIKTITLTAYRAGIPSTIDPVNNFQIILSKTHGFVQVFDLYTFPYHRQDTLYFNPAGGMYFIRWVDYYLDVLLGNLGTCDLGCSYDAPPNTINSIFRLFPFYNPTKMEIYDFAIGDVYETEFRVGSGGSHTVIYTLDSIMTKTTTAYNVAYGGTEYKMQWDFPHPGPPVITYPAASFSVSGGDTSLLIGSEFMPEEYDASFLLHYFPNEHLADPCSGNTYEIDDDYKGGGFYDPGDGFLRPSYSWEAYSIGLGMVGMYRTSIPYFNTTFVQSYSFYHKDTITCGSFVNTTPVSVPAINYNYAIKITPNPATNHIDITSNARFSPNTSVSVYDIIGRCIYHSKPGQKNTLTINTSSWNNGVYLLTIQDDTGVICKEKIVIMR
jgi:hypothetical protein